MVLRHIVRARIACYRAEYVSSNIVNISSAATKPHFRYNLVQWQSWVNPNATQVAISYQVPINIALIMFAVAYELFLGLDMVHHKNIILLLALCISNGCVLAYSVMQYMSIHITTLTIGEDRDYYNKPLVDLSRDLWKEIQPAELLVPITVSIATLLMWPIAYWVHREFSWAIYQYVQGSLQSRKQYRGYEVLGVLQSFIHWDSVINSDRHILF